MTRDLLDQDGENRAVRAFLFQYGTPGLTVGAMKRHLERSGYPYWPDWVTTEPDTAHLTKAGVQLWLRHLFALEAPDAITQYYQDRNRSGWHGLCHPTAAEEDARYSDVTSDGGLDPRDRRADTHPEITCWRHTCNADRRIYGLPYAFTRIIVCPDCGYRRCPKANDHRHDCTSSKECRLIWSRLLTRASSSLTLEPQPGVETMSTLARGSKSALVAAVQRALKIEADGDFGPQTEAAVKAEQRRRGLPETGVVDSQLLLALNIQIGQAATPAPLKPQVATPMAKILDIALKELGQKEAPGPDRTNPRISEYHKTTLGYAADDDVPLVRLLCSVVHRTRWLLCARYERHGPFLPQVGQQGRRSSRRHRNLLARLTLRFLRTRRHHRRAYRLHFVSSRWQSRQRGHDRPLQHRQGARLSASRGRPRRL